jgi:hypothetical protein
VLSVCIFAIHTLKQSTIFNKIWYEIIDATPMSYFFKFMTIVCKGMSEARKLEASVTRTLKSLK